MLKWYTTQRNTKVTYLQGQRDFQHNVMYIMPTAVTRVKQITPVLQWVKRLLWKSHTQRDGDGDATVDGSTVLPEAEVRMVEGMH